MTRCYNMQCDIDSCVCVSSWVPAILTSEESVNISFTERQMYKWKEQCYKKEKERKELFIAIFCVTMKYIKNLSPFWGRHTQRWPQDFCFLVFILWQLLLLIVNGPVTLANIMIVTVFHKILTHFARRYSLYRLRTNGYTEKTTGKKHMLVGQQLASKRLSSQSNENSPQGTR